MFNILFGLCALFHLPGPDPIRFQNGSYQPYTPNKRICPKFDPYRDTIFELYTRRNPTHPNVLRTGEVSTVLSSNIDFNRYTIMFFHGFLENSMNKDAWDIRRRYLENGDFNYIVVNSERILAGPDYLTAAGNCLPIGRFSAKFIDFLVHMGLKLGKLHVIGMSLGGQIAGITGKYVRSGRIHRITALDPAGPLFLGLPQSQRIGPDDAEFVDIIHSSIFGMPIPSGKADVWVNSASFQPGCTPPGVLRTFPDSGSEFIFCSHYQSVRMYLMSLLNSTAYPIRKCKDHRTFLSGACDNNEQTYLGVGMNTTARGNFFIKTGPTALDL